MAPAIVWEELIAAAAASASTSLRVLDPMAGSGTTVAMARLLGHQAMGFDTDPLAVLISRAWTADIDPVELRAVAAEVVKAARVLARDIAIGEAYPEGADQETKRFVRYWFDHSARRHLTALSMAIRDVRSDSLRPLLWCSLSRLIVVKSMGASLAMDVAHSRPHKVYDTAPIKPLSYFERAAAVVGKHSPFGDGALRPSAAVQAGDARKLPLPDGAADFVITSPPYLNAIDYLRGHKFSLIWMGHTVASLRRIRATNVGTEVSAASAGRGSHAETALEQMGEIQHLPDRDIGMLRRYVSDMDVAIGEMSRVLAPAGRVVLVIGDSTLRSVFIQNSKALAFLGERNGLRLIATRRRPLPPNRRYLPPPCSQGAGKQLESRMRDEVILSFSRCA
jgi:SAM-dependent methyltransferase